MRAANHIDVDGEELCSVLICADSAVATALETRFNTLLPGYPLKTHPNISTTLTDPATVDAGLWLAWLPVSEALVGYPEHAELEESAGLPPVIGLHPPGWTPAMREDALNRGAFLCLPQNCDDTEFASSCRAALSVARTRVRLRVAGTELAKLADRRSRELYEVREISSALFTYASDLAFLIVPESPDFPILDANLSARNILREYEAITTGSSLSRYITEDSISVLKSMLLRLEDRLKDTCEISFRARDAERLPASIVARKLTHQGQTAVLLLCTLNLENRARRQDSQRMRLMAARTGLVMYDVDVRQNHIEFSGALQELTGFNVHEFDAYQNGRWLVLIHPEDRADVLSRYGAAISEVGKYELHYRVRHKSGDYRHVEDVGVCIPGKDGRASRVLGTVKDVSHRVEQEMAHRKAENVRIHSQKLESLGVLAGGIAHDFNNILAAIIGLTSLALREVADNEELHADLSEVLRAGNRARDLVRQILTFSRQGDVERTSVDLGQIVSEVSQLVRTGMPRGVRIEVLTQPHTGRIHANPAQMHQVVLNFCTNAVHAMRNTGGVLRLIIGNAMPDEVTRAAHPRLAKGKYVQLSVSDEGHGMAPQVIERIFDPFYTTKGPGEGTGMGLAVVHGIVTSHGGVIDVQSQPGHGATFHVYLPLSQEQTRVLPIDEPPAPGGRERVVVVRTDEVIGAFVSSTLRHQGYAVHEIYSVERALACFRASQPPESDIVVCDSDWHTPGMSELIAAVAAVTPEQPIILIGDSRAGEDLAQEAEGQVILLEKPLTFEQLSRAARAALDAG